MLLLIDNFDSFTFNLVQAFQQLGQEVRVVRNEALTAEQCLALKPDYLVIGPGPGTPARAGISKACIQLAKKDLPILGVCLGHQAIAEVFGGKIIRASLPIHGKLSPIIHQETGIFHGLSQAFQATRYHSLIIDKHSFPDALQITAETPEGEIMGVRHRLYSIEGVQFHPESVATSEGMKILQNFINIS